MLTADQIEALGNQAQKLLDPVQEYLIREIASRISEAGSMTATAQYQVWRLQNLGVSQRKLKKELRRLLKISHRDLRKLLEDAGEEGYTYDMRQLPQVQAIPFRESRVMQDIVSAAVDLAREDLTNITQTMGFCLDPQGNVCLPLTQAYEQACDTAFMRVSTGAADMQTAVREATRGLARKGIQYIDYESGIHTTLEAATRRSILGGMGLMQEKISQGVHDEYGCNGWEISAHSCSAPDHEPIQGKQYSDAEYQALNNSLRRRIGTLNCGHSAHPIILGISRPQYTKKELESFREDNQKGVEIDEKQYTMYEATQKQRAIERAMRAQKKKILVAESTGDPDLPQLQSRMQVLSQEYSRFSDQAGLRTQVERTQVAISNQKSSMMHENRSNVNTAANLNYISSDEYRSKFSGLLKKGKDDSTICKLSRRAIKENSGSVNESYAFIAEDGSTSGLLKSGPYGGNIDISFIANRKANSVVLTHNHPNSTSFSADDINLLLENPEIKTIVAAGHDGSVYKLSIANGARNLDNSIFASYNIARADNKSPHEIVSELAKIYGWRYEYAKSE